MRRIVSVWLPQWPIERRAREAAHGSRPQPDDDALFVLAGTGKNGLTVTAANGAALAQGIWPGIGLADARARCPHLVSAPAEPETDARALAALARWCGRYAPTFNTDGADGLWIDIAGAAHLLGGEQALLNDLAARLQGLGFTARLGLADTPGGAWALARYGPGPAREHPDQAARVHAFLALPGPEELLSALDPLPVEALRLNGDALALLRRLGLKHIGQLAALPRASLKRRFPSRDMLQAVLARLDQALGVVREPPEALDAPPRHAARIAFAEPLISHQGVEGALPELARDLCAQLTRALAGARAVCFTAYRTDGTAAVIRTGFAAPCRAAGHMARLLGERAEEIDAGLGIDAMTLAAQAVEHLPAEQAGFAARDHGAPLGHLVDRFSNRLTPARVLRAAARESHLPERAEIYRPAIQEAGSGEAATGTREIHSARGYSARYADGPARARPDRAAATRPCLAPPGMEFARCAAIPPRPPLLLERPEPIDVLAEVPEGPPARFTWRRATRRIRRWQGPERIAPEWWRLGAGGSPLAGRTRDYYRIEDEAGGRYWVFRAGLYHRPEQEGAPRWYLHGVFA